LKNDLEITHIVKDCKIFIHRYYYKVSTVLYTSGRCKEHTTVNTGRTPSLESTEKRTVNQDEHIRVYPSLHYTSVFQWVVGKINGGKS